jgi:hypothetical protein
MTTPSPGFGLILLPLSIYMLALACTEFKDGQQRGDPLRFVFAQALAIAGAFGIILSINSLAGFFT